MEVVLEIIKTCNFINIFIWIFYLNFFYFLVDDFKENIEHKDLFGNNALFYSFGIWRNLLMDSINSLAKVNESNF